MSGGLRVLGGGLGPFVTREANGFCSVRLRWSRGV